MGMIAEVRGRGLWAYVQGDYFQVNREALMKRYDQGWLMEWTDDVDACIDRVK